MPSTRSFRLECLTQSVFLVTSGRWTFSPLTLQALRADFFPDFGHFVPSAPLSSAESTSVVSVTLASASPYDIIHSFCSPNGLLDANYPFRNLLLKPRVRLYTASVRMAIAQFKVPVQVTTSFITSRDDSDRSNRRPSSASNFDCSILKFIEGQSGSSRIPSGYLVKRFTRLAGVICRHSRLDHWRRSHKRPAMPFHPVLITGVVVSFINRIFYIGVLYHNCLSAVRSLAYWQSSPWESL